MMALKAHRLYLVKTLLIAGANTEVRTENSLTALMMASMMPYYYDGLALVEALLAAGANTEAEALSGETALIVAAAAGRQEIIKALLAAGANIEAKSPRGSASTAALEAGHLKLYEYLEEYLERVLSKKAENDEKELKDDLSENKRLSF